jgi:hypothetical protein
VGNQISAKPVEDGVAGEACMGKEDLTLVLGGEEE